MARWVQAWNYLVPCIMTDKAYADDVELLGKDPHYQKLFLYGMHEYARLYANDFAQLVDIPSDALVHDIGGGLGTYSMALCKQYDNLNAVIYDVQGAIQLAQQEVELSGLARRIGVAKCNYEIDNFGENADVVLLSNVLHQENLVTAKVMLSKAYAALLPGGTVIVQSLFLNENETSPLFSTLHSLSAIVIWGAGESYSANRVMGLLSQCGFCDMTYKENTGSKIIQAKKPPCIKNA